MKKFKRYALYTAAKRKLPYEKLVWYNTKGDDMFFLFDLTNNEFVRIPWANPTHRDLQSFIKGYCSAKGQIIEFEYIEMDLL